MQPKVNIGIPEQQRVEIAGGLSRFLADTYSLYLKTHHFHWNVTGPQFTTLHTMFETQYTELWAAVDEIAERIRALDEYAPGTYSQFAKLSSIKESEGVPPAKTMILSCSKGTKRSRARPARFIPPPKRAGTNRRSIS